MTTARRIAEEMGVELGGVVGYHVRYDKCASSSTVIKVRCCGGSDGDGDDNSDGGDGVNWRCCCCADEDCATCCFAYSLQRL